VNTITKNQASKYGIKFNYSVVRITYEDFPKILLSFGVKTAAIERNKKEKALMCQITLIKSWY